MNRVKKLLVAAVPFVLLTACGTTGTPQTDTTVDETPVAVDQSTPAVVTPARVDMGFQGHMLDDPSSLLSERVVYFDFNKSDIKSNSRDIIAAHAKYLSSHSSARITLEGHADERGSREYNMALGERRANAVRKFLMLQGAAASQIDVISYGEERPTTSGHDEASWQLNRRVEILYKRR